MRMPSENYSRIHRLKQHDILAAAMMVFALSLISCAGNTAVMQPDTALAGPLKIHWFPRIEPEKLLHQKGVYFIDGLKGYPQTTDYTCGPAVLMEISRFYHLNHITLNPATEMRIAHEAGTRSLDVIASGGKPGTTPDEMKRWLETHGFDVRLTYEDKEDGSALQQLKENIMKGIPTIVEWAYLGGHWEIVVGYDTRNNDNPWDDVLIMADSYDKYDDYPDGYSFVNANSFYWLWFDAFYFDKLTWRTMITATPHTAVK
jgi:hypothetical protein